MHGHICDEPAIGQCQSCWKFCCASHGDVLCENCPRRPAGGGGGFSWTHPVRQGSSIGALTLQSSGGEEPRVPPDLPPGFFRGEVLRGVLAIGDTRHSGGADLTLLSLESYEDGFSVFWRLRNTTPPSTEPASPFAVAHPRLLFAPVHDDLGAEYGGGIGGGGGGSAELWRGEARFTPAIVDGASRLEVRIEEIQWMSSAPNMRSRAEIGPWIFEISLSDMKPASAG